MVTNDTTFPTIPECPRMVGLLVNCGYARTTIHNNSTSLDDGRYVKSIDRQKRALNFRSQFNMCPNYGIPDGYFETVNKDGTSQFDRDCAKVLDAFKSKWPRGFTVDRKLYLEKFSAAKWSELPNAEKNMHTLSRCDKCTELHYSYQRAFPLKPVYEHTSLSLVQLDREALHRQGVKKFTTKVLSEINNIYHEEVGTSFCEAVTLDKTSGLKKKKTAYEKKRENRAAQRKYTKQVNEIFAQNAAISLLSEGESKAKYHRKRLAQSFQTPEKSQPPCKKRNTHSPNFENIQWDTTQV